MRRYVRLRAAPSRFSFPLRQTPPGSGKTLHQLKIGPTARRLTFLTLQPPVLKDRRLGLAGDGLVRYLLARTEVAICPREMLASRWSSAAPQGPAAQKTQSDHAGPRPTPRLVWRTLAIVDERNQPAS